MQRYGLFKDNYYHIEHPPSLKEGWFRYMDQVSTASVGGGYLIFLTE